MAQVMAQRETFATHLNTNRTGPLRVLMPTPRYYPLMGGVETHVDQVAQRLACAGLDITVLTTDATGKLPARERINGVTVLRVPAWPRERDWYFAPAMYRIITQGAWDVVHLQSYHTLVAPLTMLAARRAGIPYVVTFHGGGSSSGLRNAARRAQWTALRPLLAGAQRLVAIARFEIELYGRALRVPASRFALIPNGCDISASPQTTPAQPVQSLILSVGRLERYKGHHRVIEALPLVRKQIPDARLRVVGSGPYEAELRQLVARLGLQSAVEIGGIPPTERQRMAEAMASASLVALLSDYETHPIAALEALSLRRPVLVAETSGLAELAEQGLARSVALNSTPNEVATAIVRQLRDPLLPPPIELPTWDDCATQLSNLYHSITGRAVCAF